MIGCNLNFKYKYSLIYLYYYLLNPFEVLLNRFQIIQLTSFSSNLQALDAEIVVIVEGSNEFGNSFMTRVSYLASEILWGHIF